MDKILLHGIRLDLHIGVSEEERAEAQEVLVDVTMELETAAAGASDEVEDTVDYAAAHTLIKRIATAHPYALVEALAERIATHLLSKFPIDGVTVRVRKPMALRDRRVEWAGVEIRRARHKG